MLIYIAIAIVFFFIGKFYTKDTGEGILLGFVATVTFYIGHFGLTLTSGNGHRYLKYEWGIEHSMGSDILFGAIVPLLCFLSFSYLAYKMFKKYKIKMEN